MRHEHDAVSAIRARERTRTRMRVATVTAGVAALATAGAVAYNLPAPAPKKAAVNTVVTRAPTPSSAPVVIRYSGDDGEGDTRAAAPTATPSRTATKAPSHATSGGS
jgi:hypothetical protein